jgi:TATA-box binding protein (TBP) (component of TFIID and TFIIIB)
MLLIKMQIDGTITKTRTPLLIKEATSAIYPNLRLDNFQITNMFATINCNFPLRLEAIAHSPGQFATYNLELSAGAIYKIPYHVENNSEPLASQILHRLFQTSYQQIN